LVATVNSFFRCIVQYMYYSKCFEQMYFFLYSFNWPKFTQIRVNYYERILVLRFISLYAHKAMKKDCQESSSCVECHVVLVIRFFVVSLRWSVYVAILDFPFFFPRFTGSARLYFATRTIMNTRCGTWIHLVFAWRRSSPLINFWEPALGRYVCTATPTPITDMETTFWSTDQPPRLIPIYPATTKNHTPSCNARE